MKLYVGVGITAFGVMMLLAGGNGAAMKFWAVLFGKGLPSSTSPALKNPAVTGVAPQSEQPKGPQTFSPGGSSLYGPYSPGPGARGNGIGTLLPGQA